MPTIITTEPPALPTAALMRLLALVSPALPIGAFAYSQGLETAVEQGWLTSAAQVRAWLVGLLHNAFACLDLPVFLRLTWAWAASDEESVSRWNDFLLASRGAAELRAEDTHLGQALMRVLRTLDVPQVEPFMTSPSAARGCAYATAFALAAAHFAIPSPTAAAGFAFAWAEAQVSAAVRLVPLGQSDGVRILASLSNQIERAVTAASACADDDIGSAAPALPAISALHETQYSRLFRS